MNPGTRRALISWVWAVVFGAITLLVMVTAGCGYTNDWESAEVDGSKFAQKLSTGATVECAHLDTDLDGYCSCTVFSGSNQTTAIECGCPRNADVFHLKSWGDAKASLRGCRLDKRINRSFQLEDAQ